MSNVITQIDINTTLSAMAVIFSILGAGYHYLSSRHNKMDSIETRLNALEIKTDLFWHVIEENLPKAFHSPHTPETDALLEKMMGHHLSIGDANSLLHILENDMSEKIDKENNKTETVGLMLLIARLKQIVLEKTT